MNETQLKEAEEQLERMRFEHEAKVYWSMWEDGLGDYVFEMTMERLGVEVKS